MHLPRRPSALLALALAALAALALGAREASAFCGFYVAPEDGPLYNDASQVALMREGTRTVISMSNNYRGPAKDFALVVPVPVVLQKENVKTLPRELFAKLESLSAPRLVEYWEEDPCAPEMEYPPIPQSAATTLASEEAESPSDRSYGVKVEARFSVGEYDIVILSAKESGGLERWLRDNRYNIPRGASDALAPYIREQQKFFVARVNIAKVRLDARGAATLSPLRFSYEAQDFRLPVRLGLINAAGKQDLIVYLLGREQRYEVANYPNVFIPTNLEVSDATRRSFGPFYAALFDEAVRRGDGRGIVTEYAWQAGSCDPCPIPPLEAVDIATLGGDVLYPPTGRGEDEGPGLAGQVVLTRLHARYDGATLRDDLVFAAAPPVVGGREIAGGPNGSPERGARPDSTNNFQARYIIRHPWTGPVTCQNPRRGRWGGPPGGAQRPVEPALGLASAPRENVAYASFLKEGEPEFSVRPAGATPPGGGWARPFPVRSGCACRVAGPPGDALDALAPAALAAAAIALGRRAARRRRAL